MITTLVAAALVLGGQTQGGGAQGASSGQSSVSPSALISKMFARYSNAKTMKATIFLTAKVRDQSTTMTTELQFEAPKKLYIRQQKHGGDGRGWLIVSDGKYFAYDAPELPGKNERSRLVEKSKYMDKDLSINDIYAGTAATLHDRSTPLDILISRNEDLRFITTQFVNLKYDGEVDHKGEKVHVIYGDWRLSPSSPVTGQYRIYVTAEGDLKQFARMERVDFGGGTVDALWTWDVKAEPGATVDQSLFRIR